MKIVGDRILVKPIEEERVGFQILSTKNAPPQKGEVVEVGSGKKDDPMILVKGDIILYAKHAGTPVSIKGVDHVIMREADAYCAL